MTTTTTLTTPTPHSPSRVVSALSVLAFTLLLSACGGGKATSAEPNLVPPGAPRAADIAPAPGVEAALPASAASAASVPSSPSAPLSGAASVPSAPTAAATSLKAQIQALERSGALPALDRSASITGPDANNNGVRDDIEAYIASLPLSAVQKRAALQKAKALQNTLTVDVQDKTALQKVGDGLMASTNCLGDVFATDSAASSEMSGKIESMTANTKERAKRYIQYNSARSGSVTRLPAGDTCEK